MPIVKSHEEILKNLKQNKFAPIYTLQGEEDYFIDIISDYIEDNVLSEGEKSFNLTVAYGKETDYFMLMDMVKRYPMMSSHQVVILREAQQMRNLDKLLPYAENPMDSTILVICHKHKKIRANTKFGKALIKNGIFFTSDRLREYQVPKWIASYLTSKSRKINERASLLLEEYLGTDLSKIVHSLDKLIMNLEEGHIINVDDIEKYIGISKDYNIFELNNALLARDVVKANRIINYFGNNHKAGSVQLLIGALFGLFSRLYLLHSYKTSDTSELARKIKLPSFVVKDYLRAKQFYTPQRTNYVIGLLHEYDLKSKGVGAANMGNKAILQELVYKILH